MFVVNLPYAGAGLSLMLSQEGNGKLGVGMEFQFAGENFNEIRHGEVSMRLSEDNYSCDFGNDV